MRRSLRAERTSAAVPIYQVEKQSEEDSKRWRERYSARSKG